MLLTSAKPHLWAQGPAAPESGQFEPPTPIQATAEPAQTGPLTTVHGVVMNAATGQPLSRALVKFQGQDALGALTDGEGRFEISGVPTGMQNFSVEKPGFMPLIEDGGNLAFSSHSVRVAAQMPDLTFTLTPANAVSGHVLLTTGGAAEGIGIKLLRLKVDGGRANWEDEESHQTTPEGDYRFANLQDGVYTVMTEPEFDNERVMTPVCGGPGPAEMPGFPFQFLGGASDVAGAERIELNNGRQAQANFTLTPVAFHAVQATPVRPVKSSHWQVTSTLLDRNGQPLPYPLQEDDKTHTACAYLPEGLYTLMMEGSVDDAAEAGNELRPPARRASKDPLELSGMLDFSVNSQARTIVHVPLGPAATTPVHVRYEPRPPAHKKPQAGRDVEGDGDEDGPDSLGLWAVRSMGGGARGEMRQSAESVSAGEYLLGSVAPGAYWIQASANQEGVCVGAVTSGGVNLAHSPWVATGMGAGPAIEAVLRTDCAALTLRLPASLVEQGAGEEPVLYIYAVPEFDSVEDVQARPVRAWSETTVALQDLPPGEYSIYTLDKPHRLEFRNPAAMARLAGIGQRVTLQPGGKAELVLELKPQ